MPRMASQGKGRGAGGVSAVAGEPAGAFDAGDDELAIGAARDGRSGGDEADHAGDEGVPDQTARKFAGGGDSPAERRSGVF